MKQSFSERMGYKSPHTIIQLKSMDDNLRTSLWNAIYSEVFSGFRNYTYFPQIPITKSFLFKAIWTNYYYLRVDEIPYQRNRCIDQIKDRYFSCKWYEVYDLLEFILDVNTNEDFLYVINYILEEHLSGYRVVLGKIAPIVSEQEIEAIETAESIHDMVGCHIAESLKLLSDKTNPDYRNSIKESISAVETLARSIIDKPNATLGFALSEIERVGKVPIHKALLDGFSKIYGWTNDDQGIRHSLMNESSLSQEDAVFMLIACSAFINYLSEKSRKIGLDLSKIGT